MSNITSERIQAAAEGYLTRKGWTILETGYQAGAFEGRVAIVARDTDDAVVFVDVTSALMDGDGSFAEPSLQRWQAEMLAASWLCDHEIEGNTEIRFDSISILVVEPGDRAMLRHHRAFLEA